MKATEILQDYGAIRKRTMELAAPLSAEDQQLQSMPDASPTKWHLAHTTWFFETFVLAPSDRRYRPFDERFGFLFNSYYESVGERVARPTRGLLSRPSLETVREYRAHVDAAMVGILTRGDLPATALSTLVLGLHHEQQHQELILTDIKHALWANPLRPAYRERDAAPSPAPSAAP